MIGWLLLTGTLMAGDACDSESKRDSSAVKAEYALADTALNQAWKVLKANLSAAEFKAVQAEQRGWIEYRDLMATVGAGHPPDAEVLHCAEVVEQQAEITRSRTAWLKARASAEVAPWGGRFDDSFGGDLLLYQRDGMLAFELNVVRGHTYHTGEISGVVRLNGETALYRTESPDGDMAEVRLTRKAQMIDVETENTAGFGGMRAYFSGSYGRAGELSAEERARLAALLPQKP